MFARYIATSFFFLVISTYFITRLIPAGKEIGRSIPPLLNERYDFNLNELKSIDDLVNFVDSINKVQGVTHFDPESFVRTLNLTLHYRFYHGYSMYTFKDNFVLYVFSMLTQEKHRAIVIPDDIMLHPVAACSQQAIVFQAAVEKKGIPYRSVLLNGHFCSEVKINNKWVFIDTNKELDLPDIGFNGYSANEIHDSARLVNEYYKRYARIPIDAEHIMKRLTTGFTNSFPAQNLRMLHFFSRFLSDYAWIFCLWGIYILNWRETQAAFSDTEMNKERKIFTKE